MTYRHSKLLAIALIIFTLGACDAKQQQPANAEKEHAERTVPLNFLPALTGDYFRLDSEVVGRPYHIYVRFPEGYDKSADIRYPVVYLLDGDSMFPVLAGNHLFLHYDDMIPEAIVVGIAYGSFEPSINYRDVDFSTLTKEMARSGGAAAFHQFLEQELLPEAEARYAIDPSKRILYGQSRGGFLALYSAFNHPDVFWARIAGNPSFRPDIEQFYAEPTPAGRDDLKLIVVSSSNDRYEFKRKYAREWYDHWKNQSNMPWSITFHTIEGGTHAANSPDTYRLGLNTIFRDEVAAARKARQQPVATTSH